MKTYEVEVIWHYKARYQLSARHRIKAPNMRSAVSKALAIKRDGWQDRMGPGRDIWVKAVLIDNGKGVE